VSARLHPAFQLLLAGAAMGLILRIVPLVPATGLSKSVSYDEGVYFSAAALVARGVVPYRDFVFVHPPGILVGLAPLIWLSHHVLAYSDAFLLLRGLAGLIGAVNVALIGRLAYRAGGVAAAVVAMVLYATFPPAVIDESRLLLEPFMTLFCLLAASCWLPKRTDYYSRPRSLWAGAFLGIACFIKLYGGGIFLIACLLSRESERLRKQRITMCLSAAGVFGTLALPFIALAGVDKFIEQIFVAQLMRPPDTAISGGLLGRALHMFQYGPVGLLKLPLAAGAVVVAVGMAIAAWAWFRGGVQGRFWTIAWFGTVVFLLGSPTYFSQYAAFLAPITSVLMGMVVSRLMHLLSPASPALVAALVAMLGSVLILHIVGLAEMHFGRRGTPDLGATIRRTVPEQECLFTLPSYLGIAGNRLPPYDAAHSPLVDPYGELLLLSREHGGRHFDNAPQALRSPPSQARLRAALGQCRFVALGGEPESQPFFSAATTSWFLAGFDRLVESTPELWMRGDEVNRRPHHLERVFSIRLAALGGQSTSAGGSARPGPRPGRQPSLAR
jgi:hypothetical protein